MEDRKSSPQFVVAVIGTLLGWLAIFALAYPLRDWGLRDDFLVPGSLFLAIAWALFWTFLIGIFFGIGGRGIFIGMRLALAVAYLSLVLVLDLRSFLPVLLLSSSFLWTVHLSGLVAFVLLVLLIGLLEVRSRTSDASERSQREPLTNLRSLVATVARKASSQPESVRGLIQKIEDNLRFASPNPASEAQRVEAELSDKLEYIAVAFSSPGVPEGHLLESIKTTLDDLVLLSQQRSRLTQ